MELAPKMSRLSRTESDLHYFVKPEPCVFVTIDKTTVEYISRRSLPGKQDSIGAETMGTQMIVIK